MTPNDQTALFIAILSAHKGLGQAISVADMAGRLNVSSRQAQEIKKLAVEKHRIPVGSTCGKDHGWFYIQTQAEMDATVGNYRNRVKSLCILIAGTTSAGSLAGVMRQIAMDFEEEEIHV